MKYRICYEKTGRLIYVSHLDMQRMFQRMFRRSGLSLMFSQGFNPHTLMTYTPPLPIFASSLAEYLDIELTGDESADEAFRRLTEAAPEGLNIKSVICPGEGALPLSKLFSSAEYEIVLSTEAAASDILKYYEENPEITVEKLNKKKVLKQENIKDKIFSFMVSDVPGGVRIDTVLCYTNDNLLNPFVLIKALKSGIPSLSDAGTVSVCKTKVG